MRCLSSRFAIGCSFLVLTAVGGAASGCADDDDNAVNPRDGGAAEASAQDSATPVDASTPPPDASPATRAASVAFRAVVGDEAFSCAKTYAGLGTAGTAVKPADFRVYVHDVELIKADGSGRVPLALTQDGKWQQKELALLDFEDKTGSCDGTIDTNTEIKGTVPVGSYRGLAFKIGVPFAMNHGNQATAASPLSLTAMFWSWQSGYKFAKVDSLPQPAVAGDAPLARWNFHLGSTGCNGDPGDGGVVTVCMHPNRPAVTFDAFDEASDVITIDYAALVSGSDLTDNPPPISGCMSQGAAVGPQCAPMFERVGVAMDTGLPVAGQTVFAVKAR